MHSSLQAIQKLMERGYPDCSELRFIMATDRGKSFVKDFAHRSVGGILPSFTSYEEYKAQALSEKLGLRKIERAEELVQLTLFLLEKDPGRRQDAGFEAFAMLPAMRYARMFSLERERLKQLKGLREEQEKKIDRLFDTMAEFDRYLEGQGLFMPVLREQEFGGHTPGERDYFVNLPLFTPVTSSFYRKIPPERKLVDMPVFADSFKILRPDYPSALHPIEQARIAMGESVKPALSFQELHGKASLPAYVGERIAEFLEARKAGEQMFLLLLDETLSFYLWQTVFKPFGNLVNFSLGIPLGITSAGAKVREFFGRMERRRSGEEFSYFRMSLAGELYSHRNEYVREEQWALEAAIDFVAGLEKFAEPLGGAFGQVAGLLLQQKQFFMKGDRGAPVQVVGLGETGAPFARGMIVPVNADVFPSRVYNGPFLNFIHTPQIKNSHFEMEDLALRQFMSFGERIDIVSVLDEAKDMTPGFFFTFLKNEFDGKLTIRSVSTVSARPEGQAPFIENDAEVREKILGHKFSYTSLGALLSCPFSFYCAHIEKLPTPEIMQDEVNVNLVLGSFVHDFLRRLAEETAPLESWKSLFGKLWTESPDIARMEGSEVFKLLLFSQIDALAVQEVTEERLLVFDNSQKITEKNLETTFGESGKFRLTGRIDAWIEKEGMHTILDYKYKGGQSFKKGAIAESISDAKELDGRLQIALYAYLLAKVKGVSPQKINGCFVYIREEDPRKRLFTLERAEIDGVDLTMEAICGRLEKILSLERLEPNYNSSACNFCLFKSHCRRENFFRKSSR
ncbi:MAG: RecB family exonuclease [Syntrophobacteraceae bacterium]